MKQKILSNIDHLLISFAFAFNLCFFAPIEFYYINIFDFWFSIKRFIIIFAVVTVIVFLVTSFILIKANKKNNKKILTRIIFALLICFYLQGNYLNQGYQQLNGSDVNWIRMIGKGIINSIIWIAIIGVALSKLLDEIEIYRVITTMAPLMIIAIETVTLGVLSYNIFYGVNATEISKSFYLDESNIFNMSKDENIVYIMVDSLEADFFKNSLNVNPEYKKVFSDFTFFDNTTSCSLLTYMSMPTILTGNQLVVGETLQNNINNCFENSILYDTLEKNGYNTEMYLELALVPNNETSYIVNKVNGNIDLDVYSKGKVTKLLYDCVLYKYMPHFLKSFFNINVEEFNHLNSKEVDAYFIDDVKFNKNMINSGIKTTLKNKSFKVIELEGVHHPFNVTENVEYNNSEEYMKLPNNERQKQQLKATLSILENYINELKKAGTYDNTTIIISADHGFKNRYNPTLLIKRSGEKKAELEINNAPVSMIEDFIPTILNLATNSKDYGKDVYDYNENEERERTINNYYFSRNSKNLVYVESNSILKTKGKASDVDSFYIENEIFPETVETQKVYKFNKKIKFKGTNNQEFATIRGILTRKGDVTFPGTTVGNNASISIIRPETQNNIIAKLTIDQVCGESEEIIIKIADEKLYENIFKLDDINKEIEFEIPKELWNKNEKLVVDLEFPNAHTYSGEESSSKLGTDWVQRAFVLKDITFVEKK